MSTQRLVLLLLAGVSLFICNANRVFTNAPKPVAVIELFTSQGCSSCPAADRLLGETIRQANAEGQAVYALSFHVDYWDRLGWRDPFSGHQYTERQRRYAQLFKLQTVYTPQAVLNGRQEFVGSNRARLKALMDNALQDGARVGVQLATQRKGNTITVDYSLTGNLSGTLLNVALVSGSVSTDIGRGENAGRKLVNNNVVRAFATVPGREHGQATLVAPANFDPDDGAVIAYVQQEKTLTTLGASQIALR
ncbi:hypothetical protein FAES_2227 [Fibrella aestuarina BUZ 2]|uniref:Secreted protein n=1 Tax=Fibrella aestuarina BUZ 2 TaxID=1166018 RepID=I0K7Y3_9BACT|nr:DUF1223 domain-containing protein [Fibrella aestuarina]CCH00236.1 hypothetical protein FAES_2227 [Fibrella aestuarina BUZ 2]